MPPWERSRVPLIFAGDKLVAAVGYWVEKGFLAEEGQGGWQYELVRSI